MMSDPTYDFVLQQALRLSWDDREKLSQVLWESLHPGTPLSDEEVHTMLERRIREIDEGRVQLLSHDQAWQIILGED